MAEPQGHLVRLLQLLEVSQRADDQRTSAEFASRLAEMIAASSDYRATLRTLARVEGMEAFALRLLWCAERAGEVPEGNAGDPIVDYEIEHLRRALAPGFSSAPPQPKASLDVRDLGSTVGQFCSSVAVLRREAFRGEEFSGARRATVQALALDGERLRAAAAAERNQDVEHFSRAFRGFLEYVLAQDLLEDVRVVNLIENASLTLQTAVETLGADDYDALHQTTLLLEHPSTLLEQHRSREEGQ